MPLVHHGYLLQEILHWQCGWVPATFLWTLPYIDQLVEVLPGSVCIGAVVVWWGDPGLWHVWGWLWLGRCGWLAVVCLLLEQQGPDFVHEGEVLQQLLVHRSVGNVPLCQLLAQLNHRVSEKFDAFISCSIGCIVAGFMLRLHLALGNHVLCRVSLDLGDGYGGDALGLGMVVVYLP